MSKPWLPWVSYWDETAQRWKRTTKDIINSPYVGELSQDAAFVEFARQYAWSKHGPSPDVMTASNFPPGTSAHRAVANYFHAVMERNRMHQGENWVDPESTLDGIVSRAKVLASANPLLVF